MEPNQGSLRYGLHIDEKANQLSKNTSYFDSDITFVICDNAANTHICNDKCMFISISDSYVGNTVVTIGGKNSVPSGIGIVKWKWKDDSGNSQEFHIPGVLYCPSSPVNVLSVTEFDSFLGDDHGTGIYTKRSHSHFYWSKNTFSWTFPHSSSNLPELPINEGTSSFSWWTNAFLRKVDDSICHHCYCTSKQLEELFDKRKANKPQPIHLDPIIYSNENMIYKNSGKNSMVKVIFSDTNHQGVLKYLIRFPDGGQKRVPREFLSRPFIPDITDLPTTTLKYRSMADLLRQRNSKDCKSNPAFSA